MSPYLDTLLPLDELESLVPQHGSKADDHHLSQPNSPTTLTAPIVLKSRRKAVPLRSPRHETFSTDRPGIVFQFATPSEISRDQSVPQCHVLYYPQHQSHSAATIPTSSSSTTSNLPPLVSIASDLSFSHKRQPQQQRYSSFTSPNMDEMNDSGASSDDSEDDNVAVVPSSSSSHHRHDHHQHSRSSSSASDVLRANLYRNRDRLNERNFHHFVPSESRPLHRQRTADIDRPEKVPGGKQSNLGGKKRCLSCGTNKTPYWRDGWDNVVLCNACGIRFQKYHVKCNNCLYIPRKDEKALTSCVQCSAKMIL